MARTKTMTPKAIEANRKNALKGGRRVGSLSDEAKFRLECRNKLIERVHSEFEPIVTAMIDLATGLPVVEEVMDKDGAIVTKRFYRRPPSQDMLKYLTDQTAGKAADTLNLNATVKRAMTIKEIEEGMHLLEGRGDTGVALDEENDDSLEEGDDTNVAEDADDPDV